MSTNITEPKKLDPIFFPSLFELAHKAGLLAVEKAHVVPMIVAEHINLLDDNSPVKKSYFVSDGVCGFAWVVIRPANCAFARWMKENHNCHTAYGGGMQYWISMFNQSMQKKEEYATAFANILREFGINAYSQSRMD